MAPRPRWHTNTPASLTPAYLRTCLAPILAPAATSPTAVRLRWPNAVDATRAYRPSWICRISGCRRGDFDGNGTEEGVAREVASLHRELYAAIQQYARTVGGSAIAFTPEAFPYWHMDTNGNGRIDPEELRPDNRYPAYTPRLMQGVFNYTFVLRDPGAAYHNGRYTLQLLYDSLESLAASGKAGVNMGGKVRP
jgi:hypothetical protein